MDRASFLFYLLALIIAPLAFGTSETWSLTFMESTVLLAAALFLLSRYLEQNCSIQETPGLLLILLLPGYFLLQLLPLPGAVVKVVSPAAYELYENTVGLVKPLTWLTVTLDKKATLSEFFRFSAYGAIYFLTIQFAASRRRLLTTLKLLVYTAGFIAILAIAQKMTADGLIYWFRAAPGNTVMGPYVYHNHFSGYMEMVLPLALALFLWTGSTGIPLTSLRERFIDFFNKPGGVTHTVAGVTATVIATSIFISLSRGGVVSLCLSLFCLVIILQRRGLLSGQWLFIILVPAVSLVFVGWFGWESIIERFLKIKTAEGLHDSRLEIWQEVIPMVKNFWLTGSGAGSFDTTFPAYQTLRFRHHFIGHAHNDYLELLSTTGLAGTLLIGGFLFSIVRESVRTIGRRKDRFAVYLWAASLTGMISIGLHSFTDFNFYNGANGLYFFTLCGLLVSGAATRMEAGAGSLLPAYKLTRKQLLVPIITVILLLMAGLSVNTRAMLATSHFNAVKDISLNVNIPRQRLLAMKTRADRAVELDPLAARNFYLQANIASFLLDNATASIAYRKAIALHPLKGEYLQQYGVFSSTVKTGDDPEPLIRAAILVNPCAPEARLRYGYWLLDQKELDRGITQLKAGLSLDPRRLSGQLALLAVYNFKGVELQAILPDGIRYQLTLARFLELIGRIDEATEVYRQAETRIETGEELTAENYLTIINYYNRQKMVEDALRATSQGADRFPEDVRILILLAKLLNRNGR